MPQLTRRMIRVVIDLREDPDPDLVVMTDRATGSRVERRLARCTRLSIPEVWRHDGQTLVFAGLRGGKYVRLRKSRAFPFLTPKMLQRFLDRRNETDETTWIRSFRDWVRKNLRPR